MEQDGTRWDKAARGPNKPHVTFLTVEQELKPDENHDDKGLAALVPPSEPTFAMGFAG